MKNLFLLGCVCALLMVASNASAEEVSKSRLSAMGLSGMQTMSDSEGLAVRGMGLAATGGFVFVRDTNFSGDTAVAGSGYVGVSRRNNALTIGGAFATANSNDGSGPSSAFTISGVYAR